MPPRDYVKASGQGCALTIDASPGAQSTEVAGVNAWRGSLQVRIAAQAVEGMANEELLRFLCEALSLPRGSIRFLKGQRSSRKILWVPMRPEDVTEALRRPR